MKLNKKFLAIMLAMGCISAMGAISVSAESEENNSTIIEEPGDDGDDEDLGNIDLGNDDIFDEPEDNSSNTVTDNTDNNTTNVPVIDNVTPTPTTPIPSTPQTGDLGIILSSVAAALSAGGIAVGKRISK